MKSINSLGWGRVFELFGKRKVTRFFTSKERVIALFTVNLSHLHYNVIQRGCEAISGQNYKVARNCLAYMLDFIVMQMSKVNRERAIDLRIA